MPPRSCECRVRASTRARRLSAPADCGDSARADPARRARPPAPTCHPVCTLTASGRLFTGDYSLVDELSALLERPYDEGSSQQEARYFRSTPDWALGKAGVAFLS